MRRRPLSAAAAEQRQIPRPRLPQGFDPKRTAGVGVGVMGGLSELCIDLQDMPYSYVAHQSEFPKG